MPRSSEATSRRWNLPVQRNALADLVAPTVDEEECAFLGAQNTRTTTIEMAEKPEVEDDGVVRQESPRALRARRGLLFRHRSIPNAKGNGWACRQGARRQLASPRVLQWSASGRIAPRPSLLNACGSQPAVLSASRAAPRTACQGGGSHAEPVARSRDGLHKSYRNSRTA